MFRKDCEDFLWDSKVDMRQSFFMVAECVENEDKQLTNSKCTTVNLKDGGHLFFNVHIVDNERYQRLYDFYTLFIHRIADKVRQLGFAK